MNHLALVIVRVHRISLTHVDERQLVLKKRQVGILPDYTRVSFKDSSTVRSVSQAVNCCAEVRRFHDSLLNQYNRFRHKSQLHEPTGHRHEMQENCGQV